jgi:hypothetical protein
MPNETPAPKRTLAERMPIPVERRWLHALAGVVWTGIGVLCITYAVVWLAPDALPLELSFGAAGLVVAALFLRFVFVGVVRKNIARIEEGPTHASIFTFQGWKSWLVAGGMMAFGATLRHSTVPKDWLAVVYEGVGIALFITSLMYHRQLVRAFRDDPHASVDKKA